MDAKLCNSIFDASIKDFHIKDDVDTPITNPHPPGSMENLLYQKNWIDTVQWHLEDIIRRPDLPAEGLVQIKRRIDKSNQDRTDCVEQVDDYFVELFKDSPRKPDARLNSETPAWLVDRMSILALKIYHMREQTERSDVDAAHLDSVRGKLAILEEQRVDLTTSMDELMGDYRSGVRYMKVYRQMKMYNDQKLNPELYKKDS